MIIVVIPFVKSMLVSQFVTDFMKSDEYAKKDLESPNN